jgi:hypothetical protein
MAGWSGMVAVQAVVMWVVVQTVWMAVMWMLGGSIGTLEGFGSQRSQRSMAFNNSHSITQLDLDSHFSTGRRSSVGLGRVDPGPVLRSAVHQPWPSALPNRVRAAQFSARPWPSEVRSGSALGPSRPGPARGQCSLELRSLTCSSALKRHSGGWRPISILR